MDFNMYKWAELDVIVKDTHIISMLGPRACLKWLCASMHINFLLFLSAHKRFSICHYLIILFYSMAEASGEINDLMTVKHQ